MPSKTAKKPSKTAKKPSKRSYPVPKTKKEKSCHKQAVEKGFEKYGSEFEGRQLIAVVLSSANKNCLAKTKAKKCK